MNDNPNKCILLNLLGQNKTTKQQIFNEITLILTIMMIYYHSVDQKPMLNKHGIIFLRYCLLNKKNLL